MSAHAELHNPFTGPFAFLDADAAQHATRRALNLFVALLGIIATLPLMLVIAAAVALTSQGPILFRQVRIGINRRDNYRPRGYQGRQRDWGGQPFTMWK